jgi:glutamyl-tRNA synthetase
MTVTVRFAPSPTGLLHIGNLRPALLNWLFARNRRGTFLLRIDDTDTERSKESHVEAIRRDLSWLGLTWDSEFRQSARLPLYHAAAERLKAAGRLYACYETPEELDRRRKRQLARGLPPVYDRAALALTDADRAKLEQEGRRPHWRFLLSGAEAGEGAQAAWHDLVRGDQHVDLRSLSDPVLIREDGAVLYTLASVVDDIDLGITQIIRGDDHVTNTGVQIDIFRALGARPPGFGHHSLLVAADGSALSKRLGSLGLAFFREKGLEPMAVADYVASLGLSEAPELVTSMAELAARFDLGKLSRAPARFDEMELEDLNARLLHNADYNSVAERLKAFELKDAEAFWIAVRGNIRRFCDAADWAQVVGGSVRPVIEDAGLCETARGLAPPEPWGPETWGTWTASIREATGKKGRLLFHPLRLALTGRDAGPDMRSLLPLIGREKTRARLTGSEA